MRRFGDFPAVEDAVQEALIAASVQWPSEGTPANPRGWLYQVAKRRLVDHVRSEQARKRREEEWVRGEGGEEFTPDDEAEDDPLILLFLCCHPALSSSSAIALTLRAVGGLATAEIARAFLVPETTMTRRIGRAKQRIKDSGIPFVLPDERERAQRLRSVLQILYLMFNEGYTSSFGPDLQRSELATQAIRLTRVVHQSLPADCEAAGLLSLMLLTDARRPARTGPSGELIPLRDQDRTLWDQDLIGQGIGILTETLARGSVGFYQLQAAIAAVHDEAESSTQTDWPQILALYNLLVRMTDNPVVILNRAVATAMVHGPQAGLDELKPLDADPRMARQHRLDAVRAFLFESAGDRESALSFYLRAAQGTISLPERDFLTAQAARLAQNPHSSSVEMTSPFSVKSC